MTTALIGGALALAALWAIGLWLLPVTLWRDDLSDNANAKNWPGLIVMKNGLNVPGAVWAQEFYEARHRWRWLIAAPLIPLGRIWPRLAGFERRMELMGHEVETHAEAMLISNPVSLARLREARVLTGYRAFKGWNEAKIGRAMEEHTQAAAGFVLWHERRIREMNERGRA